MFRYFGVAAGRGADEYCIGRWFQGFIDSFCDVPTGFRSEFFGAGEYWIMKPQIVSANVGDVFCVAATDRPAAEDNYSQRMLPWQNCGVDSGIWMVWP